MTIDSSRLLRYVTNSDRLSIPPTFDWLTEAEQLELTHWSEEKRRHQWLAGRWIAKRLIARSEQCIELHQVEILSRGSNGLGAAPRVSISGVPQQSRLSISHSGSSILVGWSEKSQTMGVDLAVDVPQTESFLTAWFSPHERIWIKDQPSTRTSLLWGLKESIFKACGQGQKWNPAAVAINSFDRGQVRCQFQGRPLPLLRSWIRSVAGGVAAAVWHFEEDNKEVTLCS